MKLGRRRKKGGEEFAKPQMTSLVDVLTVLVFFLLKNFSTEGDIVTQTKNLELLREAAPRISRVALLLNPVTPDAQAYRNAVEAAVRRLGGTFQAVEVRSRQEIEGAFAAMLRMRADGVVVLQDPVLLSARPEIVHLAARHKLPAVYPLREFVELGGLMSYGVNIADQFRRAAAYVDKILKGAKPADLPIEQPTKFELIINLKTAKALGLTIPQTLLQRADQVIQ